jgi:hypothetical protein
MTSCWFEWTNTYLFMHIYNYKTKLNMELFKNDLKTISVLFNKFANLHRNCFPGYIQYRSFFIVSKYNNWFEINKIKKVLILTIKIEWLFEKLQNFNCIMAITSKTVHAYGNYTFNFEEIGINLKNRLDPKLILIPHPNHNLKSKCHFININSL